MDICPFQRHDDTANVLDLIGKPHFYPSQFFAVAVVIMKKEERNGVASSKAAAVLSLPSTVLANQVAVVDPEERGVHRIEVGH